MRWGARDLPLLCPLQSVASVGCGVGPGQASVLWPSGEAAVLGLPGRPTQRHVGSNTRPGGPGLLLKPSPIVRLTVIRFSEARSFS